MLNYSVAELRHITSAPEGITEGDNVTFEIERGTRGMNAVRISIINK